MQAAKEKLSDMASSAKEKPRQFKAKTGEKTEESLARNKEEKEMAHEHSKKKETEAEMEKHQEKSEHREEHDKAKHGTTTHVPLVHVPGGGGGRQHRPIGTTGLAPGADVVDPAFPPAGDEYM